MTNEILSVEAMRRADAYAIEAGVSGRKLMAAAGRAVAEAVLARWSRRPVLVLAGPGNNGGDGYVCARELAARGWPVEIAAFGDPDALSGDAAWARETWKGPIGALDIATARPGAILVDALFGAGLTRPLTGRAAHWAGVARSGGHPVVAIDVPSGLSGDAVKTDGPAFRADLTVTFHRFKPAHLIEPFASACGEVVLADIGVPDSWAKAVKPLARLNHPSLWPGRVREADAGAHKHRRGRLGVFTGGASATGAARMAAEAGLRAGAGLVTLLAPPAAVLVCAASATAVMVRSRRGETEARASLDAIRAEAGVIGPAAGVGEATREAVLSALAGAAPLVLDADALTSFEDQPAALFEALRPGDVLTPHAGEFARLFPAIAASGDNKIKQARAAAEAAGAVVVLKGADTVIAAPDGAVIVNRHASPSLATAGSGDVLSGVIGALLARGLFAVDAAAAGVWLHGEAGRRLGPGATAEDLVDRLPDALLALRGIEKRMAALRRLQRD